MEVQNHSKNVYTKLLIKRQVKKINMNFIKEKVNAKCFLN